MMTEEMKTTLSTHDLFAETGMKPEMREIINRWFLEVSQDFGIPYHTIAAAQNYFDRCVVKNKGGSVDLQLLALSCLTTASKFFEQRPINFGEAQSIVQNLYDQKALMATENRILQLLDWKLNCVTSYEAMAMFLSFDLNEEELISHAELFLLFSLSETSFVGYTPTTLGLASVICAFDNTGISSEYWLTWISKFLTLGPEVRHCADMMMKCMIRHSPPSSVAQADEKTAASSPRCESPANVTDVLSAVESESDLMNVFQDDCNSSNSHSFFSVSDFF